MSTSYAVLTDLEALWGKREVEVCSDWDNSGSLNTANVTNCLVAATEAMNRYIAVRYSIPLTVIPNDLIRVCCDIGMYLLCPFASMITEHKQKRYDQAIAFLKDLSTGKATLGEEQNSEVSATVAEVSYAGRERELTRESMKRLL